MIAGKFFISNTDIANGRPAEAKTCRSHLELLSCKLT
jgi:hypothetical protein